jgi:predicted Ser/Thr protein kinase
MIRCPACSSDAPDDSRFCSRCGAPFELASATATRTSLPSEFPGGGASPARHLTTDPSRSGRFLPGTVVAGRYRILGLLGRGGMGEVYRADDLKLGQAVALKFLPASVEKDRWRLQRFMNEVKIARQISHPNVCRVYDVGEVDGHHYLSMEYVDGEDLASLLRRIGRLPGDKAVQIARELCLGLAAAHEQGILHRDLKPANVMIDGRGRAKIADFGLATIADDVEGAEVGAGTPAYMAPEQRAGKDVTVRSDIYSLGLVLYELTTGKPAVTVRGESTPVSLASLVAGVDPATERVILRCLESDPALRPSSALAVAGALPGGDPLAAAVAAGETPSPQMVANATAPGSLHPLAAWVCLIVTLVLAAVSIFGLNRLQLLHLLPLAKSPEALADRARETIERLGYKPLPYETSGFNQNRPYFVHIEKTDSSPGRWERLRNGQPAALRFWLRESPVDLTPGNPANTLLSYGDPPFSVPGTVGVWLDTKGRLVQLDAVPPKHEPLTAPPAVHAATSWAGLFEAAGMKLEDFRPVPAEWSPIAFADERQAWEGAYPDAKDVPIRIEAAAFAGRPVSFRIIEPWMAPVAAAEGSEGLGQSVGSVVELVLPILILIGGALLALRNIKLGRSDRRGAFRIGMYLFAVRMLVWLFTQSHLTGPFTFDVFVSNFAFSLYRFVLVWIFYIAIEPYLRRLWPRMLISWARVLEGRWRDPLVGRDVLLGAMAAGAIWLVLVAWPLAFGWFGRPELPGDLLLDEMALKSLGGLLPAVSAMLFMHATFMLNFGFSMIVVLVLLRLLTRRTWIAVVLWVPIAVIATGRLDADLVLFLLLSSVTLTILFRLGVLPLMVMLGLSGLQVPIPATLSTSVWYAGPSWLFLAAVAAVAVYGFIVSLGGRRAFSGVLAEE